MNERIVGILIAISISIAAFIIRQSRSKRLIEKIENNPLYVEKTIKKLGTFYRKLNFDEFPVFLNRVMKIPNNQQLQKYLIIKVVRIDEN